MPGSSDPTDWIARARMRGVGLWGPGLGSPEDAVEHLTAMQAQEHRYARWSVAQRLSRRVTPAAIDRDFDGGRFLRTHVLRPTWHYVNPKDLRWLIDLSGPRLVSANSRRYAELGLDARTLNRTNELIAGALSDGPKTRRQLAATCERRGVPADGQRIAYILMHAELTAVVCSGPMLGTEHTYAAFETRAKGRTRLEDEQALGELAWRYFSTRGPSTVTDFSWWSGLKTAEARSGLDQLRSRLSHKEVQGIDYWFVDRGVRRTGPRVDLVQCYEEAIISYSRSRNVLDAGSISFHVPRHIDGFVHVLLLDGRLLGHWRVRRDRSVPTIETRLGRRLDRRERTALDRAIDRCRPFFAG